MSGWVLAPGFDRPQCALDQLGGAWPLANFRNYVASATKRVGQHNSLFDEGYPPEARLMTGCDDLVRIIGALQFWFTPLTERDQTDCIKCRLSLDDLNSP